jgi:hypothetical protein
MTTAKGSPFRELDEIVLHLKGLVLVARLREERGAGPSELVMHRDEIVRVKERLARLVKRSAEALAA